jgi:Rrf2 family protein
MLLTQTFESAVRELMFLAGEWGGKPLSHKHIAVHLGESPTYMAKVTSLLVKANILRAHRGVMGGVTLQRPPDAISLLAIMEACQGALVSDYCQETQEKAGVCAYHLFGVELQQSVTEILSRWTLARLLEKPCPASELKGKVACRLEERYTGRSTALVSLQTADGGEGSYADTTGKDLTATEN